jgi:hypothetical protein
MHGETTGICVTDLSEEELADFAKVEGKPIT